MERNGVEENMKKKIIGIIFVVLLIANTIPVLGKTTQENKDIESKESKGSYFTNCLIKNCDFSITWTGWIVNCRISTPGPLGYAMFMFVAQIIKEGNKAEVTINTGEIVAGEGPSFPCSYVFNDYCDIRTINFMGVVSMIPFISRDGSVKGFARWLSIDTM